MIMVTLWFLFGLSVGSCLGLLAASVCIAANRARIEKLEREKWS